LEALVSAAHVCQAGAGAIGTDVDPGDHRVGADLDAVLDRIGDVGDERGRLGADLAALKAKAAIDAVRAVAEGPVRDRNRPDAHLDLTGARALPDPFGRPADRVRAVRIAVRIAPRPVLTGHGKLLLQALVVALELGIADRPVRADPVARHRLEVRRVKARNVAGEMHHRAADAPARVVLAQLNRIVPTDDPRVVPVDVLRALLV